MYSLPHDLFLTLSLCVFIVCYRVSIRVPFVPFLLCTIKALSSFPAACPLVLISAPSSAVSIQGWQSLVKIGGGL